MSLAPLNEIDAELGKLGPTPAEDEIAKFISLYQGDVSSLDEADKRLAVLGKGVHRSEDDKW